MNGHIKDRWFAVAGGERTKTDRHGIGMRWQVRWYDNYGKLKHKSFDNKDEARVFHAEVNLQISRGTYVDPILASKTTVQHQSLMWIGTKSHLNINTVSHYQSLIRSNILPEWGVRTLASIKHSEIALWVASMRNAGSSYSLVHQNYVILKGILELAVKDNILATNVANGISAGAVTHKTKEFLTHSQVESLAVACGKDGTIIRTLASTGIRFGEMAALQVSDFQPLTKRLIISKSAGEVDGVMHIGTTKSNKVRSVPISRYLVDEIAEILSHRSASLGDPLFPDSKGGIIRNRNWSKRVFHPAIASLGEDFPKITPHSLRHTAASMAISNGADIKVLQLMLGHANAVMTLNQYGHLYPDRLDEIADALDRSRTNALAVDSHKSRTSPEAQKVVEINRGQSAI